ELQTEGQGERVLVGEVEERPQEVVPRVDELEERHHRERRLRQRHVRPKEDGELGGAVQHHRLRQRLRNAQEELAQKEDIERSPEKARNPERIERANPAEL